MRTVIDDVTWLRGREDLVHVACIPEIHVEVLWVPFDEFDQLDLSTHGLIGLLEVVLVGNEVNAVTSHLLLLLVLLLITFI